jgi:protein O-mannosyl-transferase
VKNKSSFSPKQVAEMIRSKTLLTCICVTAIAFITYFVFSPSLDDGFTNHDDQAYVTANPLVINNSIPLVKIIETPVLANYHPITILSLALNYRHGKLDPFGYHLENVIFHLLNTILVFFFIFLLTRRNLLMAAIVSLFFGIHPMHVESVSWISERKDVLYVFFFMAGLITYLRYSETKKTGWYIFTFLLFMLSCLSKGIAVIFPVILLLIDYLKNVKWSRKFLIEKIPFFILSLVFGIIAVKTQQAGQAFIAVKTYTVFQRLLFASYDAIMYIIKLFVPFKLSAFYPYPVAAINGSVPLVFYFSPLILLSILAALIYFFLKKEKELVFGLLFYFVSVVLVLQFISIGHVIMADRYSYLSYIGLLFIVAYIINKAWLGVSRDKGGIWAALKYPFIIIALVGAVAFSFQTYSRTQVWKNSGVLWSDVINNYPGASLAYMSRGNYYYSINELDKVIPDYDKAIALDSTGAEDYDNRGAFYFNNGRADLAMPDFCKAIALDSTDVVAHNSRGRIYMNTGKNDLALADFNMTIKFGSEYTPVYASAYANRAMIYYNYGKNDLAIADFTKAITLDSTDASAYNNRGALYAKTNKNDLAIADYNKAIAINPSSAPYYYYNRGLYYTAVYQYEKAVEDFTNGIQLNPQGVESYYDMRGICNDSLKNYYEAITDFTKAIEVNPSIAAYWLNRSLAEEKSGQSENAKADVLRAQQLQRK